MDYIAAIMIASYDSNSVEYFIYKELNFLSQMEYCLFVPVSFIGCEQNS